MRRRNAKTRQELVRTEFDESAGHFRLAANHAAVGLGASVGPRYTAAKVKASSARAMVGPTATKVSNMASHGWNSTVSTLTPLAEAAREGSAKAARLPSVRRTRKSATAAEAERGAPVGLISLLAAGAALGAAGALVARRRNRARWAEYEPSELESDASSLVGIGDDADQPRAAAKLAHWAKENTRSAVDTVRGKMRPGDAQAAVDEMNERIADATTGVTKDLTGDPGKPGGGSGSGTGSTAKAKPTEAKTAGDGTAEGTGKPGESMADEVDALLRSSKNGRM